MHPDGLQQATTGTLAAAGLESGRQEKVLRKRINELSAAAAQLRGALEASHLAMDRIFGIAPQNKNEASNLSAEDCVIADFDEALTELQNLARSATALAARLDALA